MATHKITMLAMLAAEPELPEVELSPEQDRKVVAAVRKVQEEIEHQFFGIGLHYSGTSGAALPKPASPRSPFFSWVFS